MINKLRDELRFIPICKNVVDVFVVGETEEQVRKTVLDVKNVRDGEDNFAFRWITEPTFRKYEIEDGDIGSWYSAELNKGDIQVAEWEISEKQLMKITSKNNTIMAFRTDDNYPITLITNQQGGIILYSELIRLDQSLRELLNNYFKTLNTV